MEVKRVEWRPKTYSCKKCKIGIFTEWMKGRKWDAATIKLFFDDYLTKEKRLSPSTYNDYIVCIKQALSWCSLAELMEGIEKRKFNHTPAAYFTKSQMSYLIGAIKQSDKDLWFFVQFIYYCFLRPRTELRMLRVGDIILEDKKILARAEIAKNKKQQYVAIPGVFFPVVEKRVMGRNPNEYLFKGSRYKMPTGVNHFADRHLKMLQQLGFDTKRESVQKPTQDPH